MESPTRRLHSMIRKIAELARRFDSNPQATINSVHDVVASFDPSVLQKLVPGRFSRAVNTILDTTIRETSVIQYADIYQDDHCHVNAFGLLISGLKIPLHDHPQQNAIMKVFQGAVKVRSFTILTPEDAESESPDISQRFTGIGTHQKVRFEGETVISSTPGTNCAVLGPRIGNIHEVVSLEPFTYFCDFFIPNQPSTNYYRLLEPETTLHHGQSVDMLKIRCPHDFYCETMKFPSFASL